MTAFVILGQPRTGSKMLRTALSSNPEINCCGEVFSEFAPGEFPTGCVREQFNDAAGLLNHIWSIPDVHASGLVVHDDHRRTRPSDPHKAIACYSGEVKAIWLSRRDKLAQYTSWQLAWLTSQWACSNKAAAAPPVSIRIDVDCMRKWYRRTARFRRKRRLMLRNITSCSVEYEDLLANLQEALRKICLFLGVEPRPMSPTTLKQQMLPLEQVIENYTDARRAMDELTGFHS